VKKPHKRGASRSGPCAYADPEGGSTTQARWRKTHPAFCAAPGDFSRVRLAKLERVPPYPCSACALTGDRYAAHVGHAGAQPRVNGRIRFAAAGAANGNLRRNRALAQHVTVYGPCRASRPEPGRHDGDAGHGHCVCGRRGSQPAAPAYESGSRGVSRNRSRDTCRRGAQQMPAGRRTYCTRSARSRLATTRADLLLVSPEGSRALAGPLSRLDS